jgi:3-dehydroquinate synthase
LPLSHAVAALPTDVRVITDRNVEAALKGASSAPWPWSPSDVLVLPPGESTKDLETFGRCLSWLAASGASRKTTVVALGGGVIGDLAGFVASAYMRGISLVQVPTTLLAQVDSAVGGKVGVDLPEGKNLAGAFYPPAAVSICPETLRTLPERQLRNGMAEVLKYGFILDPDMLGMIPADLLTAVDDEWDRIVMRCLALKAAVVEGDEFEKTGLRAVLNYGHTVGHAIEKVTGYGPVLHGEAISIGMVAEARLGEALGISQKGTAEAVEAELVRAGLPVHHEALDDGEALVQAMRLDKKAVGGSLAFSLLSRIGVCKLVTDVPVAAVLASLKHP